MRKMMLRLCAVMLVLALAAPFAVHESYALGTNDAGEVMIRIGLSSSASGSKSGEVIGANLWNVEGCGAGFRLGYFDGKLNFVELARTEQTQISVIKTENTWFKGKSRSSFSNTDHGGDVVGSRYLELPGSYPDYSQALAAATAHENGFVAFINGEYRVRVGSYTTDEAAAAAAAELPDSTVVTASGYGLNVIVNGKPEILFQYDMGEGTRLGIQPDLTDAPDARCWYQDLQYRGGFAYQRLNGGELSVINVLELEEYVKGVVPYEMGREWPLEALKTQAVCARTYAVRRMGAHRALGFDLCPSDHCQVYNGVGNDSRNWGASEVSDRAVEETAGQVLWYKNRLAETVYSSSHGGASENAKYVWGTDTEKEHPYLCGVVDPYEKASDNINGKSPWTRRYTSGELTAQLNSKGFGVGTAVDYMNLTYSELGNVIRLEVYWTNGQKNTFKPSDGRNSIRSAFGVNSIRFTVNGQTVTPAETQTPSYPVNGSDRLNSLEGVCVIGGDGRTAAAQGELYAVTGDGTVSSLKEQGSVSGGSNQGGGSVKVSGSTYLFEGGGWGHQVGMSQFGAYAMAQQGFNSTQICEFYYPGTHVGPIR